MSTIAMENVNVAEIMEQAEAKASVEKLQAAMEANPVVNQLLEAAETVEDMYQVAKEYITIKFEEFKVLIDKTVDYFKGPKVQLDDDVMDCVVGGNWFADFWNKHKKTIVTVAIVAGFVAVGAVAGGFLGVAALGGVGGAIAGAVAGGCAAGTMGMGAASAATEHMD